jgi:hypothetical protein
MARKPRIEFEGAFYHVIARGNQRQKIFKDEEDFKKYLNLLAFYNFVMGSGLGQGKKGTGYIYSLPTNCITH